MIDRWGNAVIEALKTPKTVLYTMTPEEVHRLLEATPHAFVTALG